MTERAARTGVKGDLRRVAGAVGSMGATVALAASQTRGAWIGAAAGPVVVAAEQSDARGPGRTATAIGVPWG